MEIVRELCSFEQRLTGTDAERRTANRLAERLDDIGLRAAIEPVYVHPQIGWIYAFHATLAFAGSLAAVEVPALGFALVLLAATSMYLDLNARLYLLRRLFFRRASQNVVARAAGPKPARLVVSAHYDAARAGSVFSPRNVRLLTRVQGAFRVPLSPSRILFWSVALLVPILGLRMADVDSTVVSVLQLLPTLAILLAIFGSVDLALSKVGPGANDNATGVATVLSLAEELHREPPDNLDLWVVLTGGEESLMQGMRAFLAAHRDDLNPAETYLVNVDSVGGGEVRYVTGEGLAVTYEFDSRLTELAAALAEADEADADRFRAAPLRHGFATDALPARLRRIPATTITCLEPAAQVPPNFHTDGDLPDRVDPDSVTAAHDFTLELIRLLDRDVGRRAD
jgi:hypothetical protein